MTPKGRVKLPNSTDTKRRHRLEFIEFRLFWTGRLNRADLVDMFRISAPQASLDIARYKEIAPANLAYDSSLKSYVRTKEFVPSIVDPSTDIALK